MGDAVGGGGNGAQGTAAPPGGPGAASTSARPAPGPNVSEGRDAAGRFVAKGGQSGAPGTGETPPEPTWKPWKGKLTVFGKEEEAEIASEEDLRRELQIARAARVKLKELKQREELLRQEMEGDPLELLRRRNVDPLELSRRILADAAKRELMTPEERVAAEATERAKKLEAELAELKKRDGESRLKEQSEKLWATLQPEFESALKESGLPAGPATLRAIGRVGLEFLKSGLKLTPRQVVAEVKRQRQAELKGSLGALDDAALYGELGQERFDRLVKWRAEQLRAAQGQPSQAPRPKPNGAPKPAARAYATEEDWRARLSERAK